MTIPHTPTRLTVRANGDANSYALLDDKGHWFMSMLVNGEQMTEWMVSKAFMGRPSVAQLTNLGINVPIGATSFHTRADGCVGVCVFNVNLSEVYQGKRLVTGAEFVEVTLNEKQMDGLKELGWVGSLGFHFWNVGQLGAYGGVE